MKKIARMIGVNLVIAICALILLPVQARGVDVTRSCDITLISACDGEKIPNAGYRIYHLADFTGSGLQLQATERFQSFQGDLKVGSLEDWPALAETLRGFVDGKSMKPDYEISSDSKGSVTLSGLKCGLYLVICQQVVDGNITYDAPPFCVAVPYTEPDNQELQYSVTAKPKYTKEQHDSFIDVKVVKKWDDSKKESLRPSSIEIILNQDGQPYDKVTLTKDTGWVYTWQDLPADSSYSVSETTVANYKCTVARESNTFQLIFKVTNTFEPKGEHHSPEPPKPPVPTTDTKLPQTGQLWWPVAAFGVSGLLLVLVGVKMRRIKRHD